MTRPVKIAHVYVATVMQKLPNLFEIHIMSYLFILTITSYVYTIFTANAEFNEEFLKLTE